MESSTPGNIDQEDQGSHTDAPPAAQPNNVAVSISDLLAGPDFPESARGRLVNIGGTEGTVSDIVGNSLKVKSEAGATMSFNLHVLKRLYGPREEQKPLTASFNADTAAETRSSVAEVKEDETPRRNIITDPDYSGTVKPIREFTGRADFPQCTFGEYVDVGGYKGVVVEIVRGSLKVRSPEEIIRSYNSQVIRKLYPPEK